MEIKNFVELPCDKYNNRSYTPGDEATVISAKVEPGTGKPGTLGSLARLHVVEPEHIKSKWPTLSALYWKEVDCPAGEISDEKWHKLLIDNGSK